MKICVLKIMQKFGLLLGLARDMVNNLFIDLGVGVATLRIWRRVQFWRDKKDLDYN